MGSLGCAGGSGRAFRLEKNFKVTRAQERDVREGKPLLLVNQEKGGGGMTEVRHHAIENLAGIG